jgi:hypothetical protein
MTSLTFDEIEAFRQSLTGTLIRKNESSKEDYAEAVSRWNEVFVKQPVAHHFPPSKKRKMRYLRYDRKLLCMLRLRLILSNASGSSNDMVWISLFAAEDTRLRARLLLMVL